MTSAPPHSHSVFKLHSSLGGNRTHNPVIKSHLRSRCATRLEKGIVKVAGIEPAPSVWKTGMPPKHLTLKTLSERVSTKHYQGMPLLLDNSEIRWETRWRESNPRRRHGQPACHHNTSSGKKVCLGQYEALSGNASAFGQFRNKMGVTPTGFEPAMLWLKARGLDRLPTTLGSV